MADLDVGMAVGLIKALGSPDPAVIEGAVNDWLDDHPEATTTVQDGSITKAKLDSNLQGTVDDVTDLKSEIIETNAMNEIPQNIEEFNVSGNTTQGITYTKTGTNKMLVNGTASAQAYVNFDIKSRNVSGTEYFYVTTSNGASAPSGYTFIVAYYPIGGGSFTAKQITAFNEVVEVTYPQSGESLVYLKVASGTVFNNVEFTVCATKEKPTGYKISEVTVFATPQMYGAVGDGVADDTNAIRQAFNHSNVYLPSGNYLVTDKIDTNATNVKGEIGATITYGGDNALAVLFFTGNSVEIDGITIDGNFKSAKGISVSYADTNTTIDRINIRNCTCKNFDNLTNNVSVSGIYSLRRAKEVSITNCMIENVRRTTGDASIIASVGIAVLNIEGSCSIKNNIINNILYDNTVQTDADGVEAFVYNSTTSGLKNVAIVIENNVITQCQGRFIKVQGENCTIKNNTLTNNGIALIDNFKAIDLQTGKGVVFANVINVSGVTSSNINSSSLISATSRSYTNNIADVKITNNILRNDVQGGYGILFIPYDMETSLLINGNTIYNCRTVFYLSDELNSNVSIIICNNTLSNFVYGPSFASDTDNITKIIENNSGYTYSKDALNTQLNQYFTVSANTFKEFCSGVCSKYSTNGNYICVATWQGHSSLTCIVTVKDSRKNAIVYNGGYIYTFTTDGTTEDLFTFNYDGHS